MMEYVAEIISSTMNVPEIISSKMNVICGRGHTVNPMRPCKGWIVQALFNNKKYSDLRMVVNGNTFYCHRVVLEKQCEYLRFGKWPATAPCPDEVDEPIQMCTVHIDL